MITDGILAIDPGANGGLAWVDKDGKTHAVPMPETHGELIDIINVESNARHIVIEKVGGYVKGVASPGSAMFNFGFGVGVIHGIAAAFQIPLIEVSPARWQKAVHMHRQQHESKTEWKRRLKVEASKLYPRLRPTLKTADALLILHAVMERGLLEADRKVEVAQ